MPCYGSCLNQTDYGGYEKVGNCDENCEPIPCPNWLLCKSVLPEQYLLCHGGRCVNCNIIFGSNLHFIQTKKECNICLEEKPLFVKWECPHDICLKCFKINYGWGDETEEDREEDTLSNTSSNSESEPKPDYIGKCPLCRHKGIPYWRK